MFQTSRRRDAPLAPIEQERVAHAGVAPTVAAIIARPALAGLLIATYHRGIRRTT